MGAQEQSKLSIDVRSLPSDLASLSARHLQLSPVESKRLRIRATESIGDVLKRRNSARGRYLAEFTPLGRFLSCIGPDGTVDWMEYWRYREFTFYHLYMQAPEFDLLVERIGDMPINRETCGKAGMSLSRNGISSFRELRDRLAMGIPNLSGFGRTKTDQLFDTLMKLISCTDEEGRSNLTGVSNEDFLKERRFVSSVHVPQISEGTRLKPITTFHIGQKTKRFASEGFKTFGDLLDGLKAGFQPIRGVGKKAIERLFLVSSAALCSLDANGNINWKKFCEETGIPMIPNGPPVETGGDFIDRIEEAIQQLLDACADDVERAIVADRLTQKRSKQKTLEELSWGAGVTRERIRQKERKLLQSLFNALLYDEYTTLDLRFQDSFAKFFKIAAGEFTSGEEIILESFLIRLEKAWSIDRAKILPHVPFITAILTNKAVKPPELQLDRAIPIELSDPLPENVSTKKLVQLPLGKAIKEFHHRGITSLGAAVEKALAKELTIPEGSRAHTVFRDTLESVSEALRDHNQSSPFWLRFAGHANLTVLPTNPPKSPRAFVTCVKKTIEQTLEVNCSWKNSVEIFRLRTSRPRNRRLTLKQVSEEIGILAPHVKKTETVFVRLLHRQLVERNFTDSKIFFRSEFLGYWKQAKVAFDEIGDFSAFKRKLAKKWQLTEDALFDVADMIWTVFNIYPRGRKIQEPAKSKRENDNPVVAQTESVGVIKLRGFKRVY